MSADDLDKNEPWCELQIDSPTLTARVVKAKKRDIELDGNFQTSDPTFSGFVRSSYRGGWALEWPFSLTLGDLKAVLGHYLAIEVAAPLEDAPSNAAPGPTSISIGQGSRAAN